MCDCTFANDGNASWHSVCRVPMVEWRLDCENCRRPPWYRPQIFTQNPSPLQRHALQLCDRTNQCHSYSLPTVRFKSSKCKWKCWAVILRPSLLTVRFNMYVGQLLVFRFKFKFKFKILYYLFREIYPWCHSITANSTFHKNNNPPPHQKSILIKTITLINTINMELTPPPHTHTHTNA